MLAWSPVTTHMDGSTIQEPVSYQVYRSQGGGPFAPVGGLQEESEYVDANADQRHDNTSTRCRR